MKIIKLTEDHYIVVDDSEIKEDSICCNLAHRVIVKPTDLYWANSNKENLKVITHSTQPLGFLNEHGFTTANLKPDWTNVEYLPLSEVKELLGIVDVEKKALEISPVELDEDEFDVNETHRVTWVLGYIEGYKQALEDNKEKKYTKEDMVEAYKMGLMRLSDQRLKDYMLPKTEWEVEFVDDKLKLKS